MHISAFIYESNECAMQNFRVVGHDIPRLAKSRCGRPLNATALTHSIHYLI